MTNKCPSTQEGQRATLFRLPGECGKRWTHWVILPIPQKALVIEQNYSWSLQVCKTQSAERGGGSFAFSGMKSYYEADYNWDNKVLG